ncbi:GerMN domain-containing protein [Streptomyces sp. RFCAC02]|uniref:GerMN domain-containing protein n=1 Tax=Streptomyces sp. RFCAC02 TaxID=2499143 RepID=UPI0010205118|nr:GerMN domain-containing protein [Streptomyces sp. RFCAC02]
MRRPLPRAALATAAAALLLTGCGIRQTGTVDAGGPGTPRPAAGQWLLFFVAPDGRLTPVPRPAGTPSAPEKAVAALFSGPGEDDRAAGLATDLPPGVGLRFSASSAGETLEIRVTLPMEGLGETAVQQIVCTAAYATGDARTHVTLTGSDTSLPPAQCAPTEQH